MARVPIDLDSKEFRHTTAGRRPATILGLAASTCFLALGAIYGAPWWWHPPVLFAVGLASYAVFFNPQSGIHLNSRQLSVFSGSWTRSVERAELISISIVDWSDGPPTATAILDDGTSFAIPSMCLPERAVFVDALKRFGIAIV